MEHVAAILLIIGCSNNLQNCHELPAPVTVFETAQECAGQRPFTLDDMAGQQPRIFGKCLPVDPALEEEDGNIVWDVTPDGRLEASVEQPGGVDDGNLVVAAADLRPERDYLGQE
jgi:hypothetical protein